MCNAVSQDMLSWLHRLVWQLMVKKIMSCGCSTQHLSSSIKEEVVRYIGELSKRLQLLMSLFLHINSVHDNSVTLPDLWLLMSLLTVEQPFCPIHLTWHIVTVCRAPFASMFSAKHCLMVIPYLF